MEEDEIYKIMDTVGDILGVDTHDVILEVDFELDVEAELEYLYDDTYILRLRDGLDKATLKRCIIHELTHYKQHLEGRLVSEHLKIYWEGELWKHVDFLESPWEVEAYKNEEKYLELL